MGTLREGGEGAIAKYRQWIQHQPKLLARLPELRGKVLGCWCAPKGGLPGNINGHICHGEVLAALADSAGGAQSDDEDRDHEDDDDHDEYAPITQAWRNLYDVMTGVRVSAARCEGCGRWLPMPEWMAHTSRRAGGLICTDGRPRCERCRRLLSPDILLDPSDMEHTLCTDCVYELSCTREDTRKEGGR